MCEIIGVTTMETGRAEPGPGTTFEMPGIGVGGQSTLGGGDTKFLPEKYVLKIIKMLEF